MECPSCGSPAVGEINYEVMKDAPEQLEYNKCHECSCMFPVFIFSKWDTELQMEIPI